MRRNAAGENVCRRWIRVPHDCALRRQLVGIQPIAAVARFDIPHCSKPVADQRSAGPVAIGRSLAPHSAQEPS